MRRLAFVVLLFLLWAPGAYAWTWPAQGPVLLGFNFDSSHPYAGGQHRGIDIGIGPGTPVVAPTSGTVTFAGTVPTSGKSVTIATGDGYSVTLTHLGSIGVSKGASVGEGDAVGTVGPSGTPELDVPYVYMGVRVTAQAQGYLDPLSFLPTLPPPVPVQTPPPPPPAPVLAPPPTEVTAPPPVETVTTPDASTAPVTQPVPTEPAPNTTTTEVTDSTPVSDTVPDNPAPKATSTPDSGAGDLPDPPPAAETPPDAPAAEAPPSANAPVADAPTPDASPVDVPTADAAPTDARAEPPVSDTDATPPARPTATPPPPPPVVAPASPLHVIADDPGVDPTAPSTDDAGQPVDAAAAPADQASAVAEPAPAAAPPDDAFVLPPPVVGVTPPAAPPALVRPVVTRRRPQRPAPAVVKRVVPVAVRSPRESHAVRRVPIVPVPQRVSPRRRREAPIAVRTPHRHTRLPWLVLTLLALACAAGVKAVRMISSSSKPSEGARTDAVAEDPRRGRVAVREWPAAPGPCRRPGRAVRHLRALSPAQRQRRPHGERHGRARHAGDGVGGSRGRVAP